MLCVAFFVTAEKIVELIVGFNVIAKISMHQEQYRMEDGDLSVELKKSMPAVKNVDAFVNLIQTQIDVDICKESKEIY